MPGDLIKWPGESHVRVFHSNDLRDRERVSKRRPDERAGRRQEVVDRNVKRRQNNMTGKRNAQNSLGNRTSVVFILMISETEKEFLRDDQMNGLEENKK